MITYKRGDDAHEFLSQSQCPKCSKKKNGFQGFMEEVSDRWEWNDNVLEQEYKCRNCGAKFLLGHRYFFIKEIK